MDSLTVGSSKGWHPGRRLARRKKDSRRRWRARWRLGRWVPAWALWEAEIYPERHEYEWDLVRQIVRRIVTEV